MNGSATWSFMMFACELCGTFFCVCVASRFIAMPHCRCCALHSLQFEIMCGALIRFWLKLLTTASPAICSYFSSVMLQFGEWNIIFHVWKREKERSIFPMAKVWMEAMSAVEFFFREEKKRKALLFFRNSQYFMREENSSLFSVLSTEHEILFWAFLNGSSDLKMMDGVWSDEKMFMVKEKKRDERHWNFCATENSENKVFSLYRIFK